MFLDYQDTGFYTTELFNFFFFKVPLCYMAPGKLCQNISVLIIHIWSKTEIIFPTNSHNTVFNVTCASFSWSAVISQTYLWVPASLVILSQTIEIYLPSCEGSKLMKKE